MKELSIEEKAKAYDEVLERAREEYEIYKGVKDVFHCEALERIFHKLAESEDEKTRKALINTIKELADEAYVEDGTGGDFYFGDYDSDQIIAWLEKQGEQKPAEWSEEDEYQINTILHGLDLKRELYKKEGNQVEENRYSTQYNWLKSLKDRVQPRQEWSEEDEEQFSFCCAAIEWSNYSSDEHRNYAISFLESLKDRVQPQPKQEWSEEDERNLQGVIDEIEANKNTAANYEAETYDRFLDWLKSLRPQKQWKPSDEMLEALYRVIPENVMEKSEDEMLLDKLYQGLKYGRVLSKK